MTSAAPSATSAAPNEPAIRRLLRATEVDTRMLGMIGALALIWIGFNIYYLGSKRRGPVPDAAQLMEFDRPDLVDRRHGDRAWCSSSSCAISTFRSGPSLASSRRSLAWRRSTSCRPISASTIRRSGSSPCSSLWRSARRSAPFKARSSPIIGIPSFIVTLGGQLFWRGAAWWVTAGQTIAPLDDRFALMGGGPHGSVGATASWIIAAICCAGIVFGLYAGRQRRARFRFPQRPMWAEYVIAARRLLRRPRRDRDRQRLSLARAGRRGLCGGQQHSRARRRAGHRHRIRDSGADRARHRRRHDLPREAHPVWPLCLRHRRQPGSRRTRRRQHQEDHDSSSLP